MSLIAAHQDLPGKPAVEPRAAELPPQRRLRLAEAVRRRVTARDPSYPLLIDARDVPATEPADFLFATHGEDHAPAETFPRLRWGGQLIYLGTDEDDVRANEDAYRRHNGFVIEQPVTAFRAGSLLMRLLTIAPRVHYFIARKVRLLQPGESTDRFTFDVMLTRDYPHDSEHRTGAAAKLRRGARPEYAVLKQVPTTDDLCRRLIEKHPNTDPGVLRDRARKLVEKIFPVFLTREAAFLKLLQRDLPESFRGHVPQLLHLERDNTGMVRKLVMSWLRVGGQPLTQLEFARQSAGLLHALHETVGIMHLDLRLDNIVITPRGVGFVDFGSAVRIGEDISKNPMLNALFDEMMSTSQIQRLLGRMKTTGKVTSHLLCDAHHRVDKAVDLFYLAVMMTKPQSNPDLAAFIEHHPDSEESQRLTKLSDAILRPKDPQRPAFASARDMLRGIERIAERLQQSRGFRREAIADDSED